MTEAEIQRDILLAAPRMGVRLLRNNIGKFEDKTGRWVSYGLGGSGGSDLIGWTMHRGVAVFTAVECKAPGARTSKERLNQQIAFVEAVSAAGGIAGVCFSVLDFSHLVEGWRLRNG